MTCGETGLRVRASPHRTTVRLEQSRDGERRGEGGEACDWILHTEAQ